ncbi:MAG: Ig-like domain-containing protein [Eubacteriales bacterium]|nr:Ig-like domain-containing protein [Eubacteriales bacterium]MDD3883037.1 Ig-like domain-containing protein [Eubacteriales bacterium]MDD4513636.1 Ig-like domain-containing protein [Eubacteriales bacterium]
MRRYFAVILILLLTLCPVALAETKAEQFSFSEKKIYVDIRGGDTYMLPVEGTLSGDLIQFRWSSSGTHIATAKYGVLTIKRTGTVTITAYNREDSSIRDEITVVIKDLGVPDSVIIDSEPLQMIPGTSVQLSAHAEPETASQDIAWTSLNDSIATVSEDGIVTAVSEGRVTIRATSSYAGKPRADIRVTVAYLPAPDSITLKSEKTKLSLGDTIALSAEINPSGCDEGLIYSSSDDAIASVDENGVVTALSYGEAEITAQSVRKSSISGSIKIYIEDMNAPKSIALSSDKLELEPTESALLSAITTPADATQGFVWESSDEKIATVDESGLVRAQSVGKCEIFAYSRSTKQVFGKAEVTVRFLDAPRKIKLDSKEISLTRGDVTPIEYTLSPVGASSAFGYEISDSYVATVLDGSICALMMGETTITMYSLADPDIKAEMTVKVDDPNAPETMKVDETFIVLDAGEQYAQHVTVTPEGATDIVKWSSDSPDIVFVSEDGILVAKQSGSAMITCESALNRALTTAITVVVRNPERELIMPERRTGIDGIADNIVKIEAVKQSALKELQTYVDSGVMTKNEYEDRERYISNAFEMYSFPWMVTKAQKYWNKEYSENGAKDFKPGIVYYGLPYISGPTNWRKYNAEKAVEEEVYLPSESGEYYILNADKDMNGKYGGCDCSSFAGMSYFGLTSRRYSFCNTRTLATDTEKFYTVRDYEKLKPGDLMVRFGSHVVMFLYYANESKTQIVIIQQGGNEPAINTVSTGVYNLDYYTDNDYFIRRHTSFPY